MATHPAYSACFEPAEYPPTALISGLPVHQCILYLRFDLLRRLGSRWPCWTGEVVECRNSWSRFDGCLETLRAKLALGWAWRFASRSEHSSLDFVEVDAVPPAHHQPCTQR